MRHSQAAPERRSAAAPVSAVILAGGQSRRLGTDKAFLPVGGKPLIVHAVTRLSALSDDLVIVTNRPSAYEGLGLQARLIPDARPGVGALMGLYSGLRAAQHRYALVVGCDMPFLSLPLLTYMLGLRRGHDVVIPRLGGLSEPMHAIYGRRCLAPIARLLDAGERQIVALFPKVRVRYVERAEVDALDPLHLSFVNVNTVEDWHRVQQMVGT